ncbi:LamG domain-containing protein [Actinocrispum sp. NPDC049592]|uniref:LamG domain-containing protein n=1 Tax=Actinocrispum sp. NPDC049592 TaxID=3154835 RepID=UPI00343EB619
MEWRRKPLALVTTLLGVAAVVTAAQSTYQEPPVAAPHITETADQNVAMAAAYRQHEPVVVTSLGTPTRKVSAQPDGTMVAELSAQPMQVKRGSSWVPVDPALVMNPDRTVTPKTVTTGTTMSGGGSGPLLKYGPITLTWPGALPAPALDGPTATYHDVLPGVDLELTAAANNVSQHLVVRDAQAARNPALARIKLGIKADGVKLAVKDGALQATDAAGNVVYDTPPASMWDASNERTAPVGLELDGSSLTLVPDQKLLTDPKAAFPVTIDPDWHTFDRSDWAKVFSNKPNSTHWYGGNDVDTYAKIGRCSGLTGCTGDSDIGIARSYWQFDTSFLANKRVIDISLNATILYSPRCADAQHELWIANTTFGPGLNWNTQPAGTRVGYANAQPAYSGCAGNKGIGWNLGGYYSPTNWSAYFIRASDEGNTDAWRKYDAGATRIIAHYNTKPDPATELTTEPAGTVCKWCAGKAYLTGDWVRLKGRITDPDGSDQLTANWSIKGGTVLETRNGPVLQQGNTFSTTYDLTKHNGQEVTWSLRGDDGWDTSDSRSGPGFIVDRDPPTSQPGVTPGLYQADERWHGGVGVPGTFTFDAGSPAVTDVDHYVYRWDEQQSVSVDADALGGKATVTTTPPADGPHALHVQSVDRAGNPSPETLLHLYVRPGSGAVSQYSFEGNAKDTAFLGNRDGVTTGGTSYTSAGAVNSAITLDGTTGYVTAPNAVRTDGSFTVSAWTKITRAAGAQAIVSQDGTTFAGFDLWYRPDNGGRWVFAMANPDTVQGAADLVWSSAPAQLNTWTQVTGVYDAPANQLRLYVNGVLSGSIAKANVPPKNSSGSVRIGRTMWDSHPDVDYLQGSVDEVKIYDRILNDADIRAAVSRDNVQLGYWKFDEPTGTTANNAIPGGSMGVLQGGAHFVQNAGAVDGALQLDNDNDIMQTDGPVLRTDQSYSVALWAKLDSKWAADSLSTAVAQFGNLNSGMLMGYRASSTKGDKWEFYTFGSDEATHPGDAAVQSSVPAKLGEWTHLAAVYDASAKEMRIYVNGVLAGTAAKTAAFNATGPMVLGRNKDNGLTGNQWHGSIDELRAYSRVLSDAEIRGIVGGDAVARGQWKLDGNTNDSSSNHLNATMINGGVYTAGQSSMPDSSDLAARLDGPGQQWIDAPHTVDTDRSFSVAAWARVDKLGGLPAVVSEDGSRISAFKVRAADDGHWSFIMFNTDDTNASRDEVLGGTVQLGQWTHLVAVYDAPAKQLQLYVNGVLAGSTAHTQSWNATGGLQIGRAKWNGGPVEYFTGAIDDVAGYSRALFASEIQAMAGRDLSLVHDYQFDESSGRNAADSVGSRGGTINGNAAYIPGRVGNALTFHGGTDSVTTSGLDVRTDQAFTVSAWVRLPDKSCDFQANPDGCKMDAVTVDGTNASKFRLGHVREPNHPFGVWTFAMPESDTAQAPVTQAAVSVLQSDLNTWTHLVGVYDPATKKIWLYVNGTRVGDGTLNSAWAPPAGAGLVVGRGKVAGKPAEQWVGDVDDVRMYTGQLDKTRVSALYRSYAAATGAATLPATDAASWSFDEGTGTIAKDTSGRGMTATLKGGASWVGGRKGVSALKLDNTAAGYAETDGPVVDTAQSFSVATWVFLQNAGADSQAVIGQDGARLDTFSMGYNGPAHRWTVVVPAKDVDNPGQAVTILNSTEPPNAGEWTHLAMSYDANLHQLRLYVNGMLSAAQVGVTILPAPGPMAIGRTKWNGNNASFFNFAIDDVRVFGKALADGEVRKIHDDVADGDWGYYRFDDGTAKDATWRKNDGVATNGVTYGPGVTGKAAVFDGTGTLTNPAYVPMHDSFSVSAWARLNSTDQVATVIGQDGDRNSGYVLQYRPDLNRWVFGAYTADADGAPMVYAADLVAPKVNEWTHLAGVYDYPARQLRLYVNGQLVSFRNSAVLWPATGKQVIGRGKVNGVAAGYFRGALDEVHAAEGVTSDSEIAERAGWPAPVAGQLGRFVNGAGDHYTGPTDQVRPGYHFEGTLGRPAAAGANTRALYACSAGKDAFTSVDSACEGQTKVGDIGLVYTVQPTNIPTIPIYRCNAGADRFESRSSTCEGATSEGLLGYSVGYGTLTRYILPGYDDVATVDGSMVGAEFGVAVGVTALVQQPDSTPLMLCRNGNDSFASTDAACEGKTVVGSQGYVWTVAPAGPSQPIYRCKGTDSFISADPGCAGYPMEKQLGYVLVNAPADAAVFGS